MIVLFYKGEKQLVLVVNNLSYKVGSKILFHNLNFTVKSGSSLLLTGPSGSGKSTILKLIARLVVPQSGTIQIDGKNITDLPIETYRQKVSYATQSAQLFGQKVADNLNLPFIIRNQPIDIRKQEKGLDLMGLTRDYLKKPISELSGGERQRVGLLRNLLFVPKILLLDEISTGLDIKTKNKVWKVIYQLQSKNHFSLISISHDQEEIAQAKNILRIGGEN